MSRQRPLPLALTIGVLLLLLVGLFFLTHPRETPVLQPVLTEAPPPLRRILSAPAAVGPDADDALAQTTTVAALTEKLSARLTTPAVRAN
jgi:hypothetical protein